MIQKPIDQDLINHEIEIIPNRLYFYSTNNKKPAKTGPNIFEFNVDDMLEYNPFHHDFGPLKISCVYQYIDQLALISSDPSNSKKKFWHVTAADAKKYTNSIFLICAYMLVTQRKTPEEAYRPFEKFKIIPFRDSSSGNSTYELSIVDCLRGLAQAMEKGWFTMEGFKVDEYQYYERTENGDINEIVKDRIYALSLPPEEEKDRFGKAHITAEGLVKNLKKLGIQVAIQLNVDQKFSQALRSQKIANYILPFREYSCPEPQTIQNFLQILSKYDNTTKIAVVCKTGLGKTGTMIGCYVIKEYGFSAAEYMGWVRLCRPGCVVGPQQQFLVDYDEKVNKANRKVQVGKSPEKKSGIVRRNSLMNALSKSQSRQDSSKRSIRVSKTTSNSNGQKKQPESPNIIEVKNRNNSKKVGFDIDEFFKDISKS